MSISFEKCQGTLHKKTFITMTFHSSFQHSRRKIISLKDNLFKDVSLQKQFNIKDMLPVIKITL